MSNKITQKQKNMYIQIYNDTWSDIKKGYFGVMPNLEWKNVIKNNEEYFSFLEELLNLDDWSEKSSIEDNLKMMINDNLKPSLDYLFEDNNNWKQFIDKINKSQEKNQNSQY